jgi:hypothetical protein
MKHQASSFKVRGVPVDGKPAQGDTEQAAPIGLSQDYGVIWWFEAVCIRLDNWV